MKFKGTGEEKLFINQIAERDCPDKVYVDGRLLPYKTCKYKFPKKMVTINLNWDKEISNFYRLFADISNIIEIDFSQYDTSLIQNMAYMFKNCESLVFANLSNIDISSVINAEYMFSNCISLKALEIVNVNLEIIPNHKNIFFNCMQLKNNHLFNRKFNSDKRINKNVGINNNKNKKRTLEGEEICDIYNIFNETRTCRINVTTANQNIIEGLKVESYRKFLIDNFLQNENGISVREGNDIFSLTIQGKDKIIDLADCEVKLRYKYYIPDAGYLYIYKHEVNITKYDIPKTNFEVFTNTSLMNISYCPDKTINYNLSIDINELESYKYNPSDEYYWDNCTYLSKLSLYERKKEFNEKNLSICPSNCIFKSYDNIEKTAICYCDSINTYERNEELLYKFELYEEDKNKCIKYCGIYDIFTESRDCLINLETSNQEIVEELKNSKQFRDYLINEVLYNKNETTITEGNERFSISKAKNEEIIGLGECEERIKDEYNINKVQDIYIYKHEILNNNYIVPIIDFEVFVNSTYIKLDRCKESGILIRYIIPITINEYELYKYNPSDEYYSDNCTFMDDLSLYDRKKEYNDRNLSLCQYNCFYNSYDYEEKKVTCYCVPENNTIIVNDNIFYKFDLIEEDKYKCSYEMTTEIQTTNAIKFCDVYDIFNEYSFCVINEATANQDIVDELKYSQQFRDYLINVALYNKNETSIRQGNEIFSLSVSRYDKTIKLGSIESDLRAIYNITEMENIYLYKHEYEISGFKIPIIFYEVFNLDFHFNISLCQNDFIEYNFPVKINEEELYKYIPSDEYYSVNCTYMDDLSLYDRKKEYNDKNLSLCQSNCIFDFYNNETKEVTCLCPIEDSNKIKNIEDFIDKFDLTEEDKYKCTNKTKDENDTIMQQFFDDLITGILSNKTGKEKENIFEDMITGITNGSLDAIIDLVINDKKDFVTTIDGDTYHLSTISQQLYSEELTAVDLGDCEDQLRSDYSLGEQELLIFKIEHNVPSFKIPIIEYVLFTQDGRINIELDNCKDIPINYLIPVNISGDQLYLYDPNNEFYNDLCHPHTSDSGTDMTLYERKNEYNIQNMSLCESGCDYEGYNATTKKSKCTCPIKTKRNFFEIEQDKLLDKFKNYKDIINIKIVKCLKLVFSPKGIKTNIGSYILISIAGVNAGLIAFFYIKGFGALKSTMKDILNKSFKEKDVNVPPKKDKKDKKGKKDKKDKKKKNKKSKNKDKQNDKSDNIESVDILNNRNNDKPDKKKNNNKRKSIAKFEKNTENKEIIEDEIIYFNDYELNSLSFDDALKHDTRTYWQYYLSLIRTKELLVFTFYTKTDYNSRQLKIILFLLSFALFYTVNALFFNDSTMHQIYEDEGSFNFVYQIPQILYSTIISTVIKMIISFLSLTEKNFIALKNKKSKKLALKEFTDILKCIGKKCIAFFILCYLFTIIFWYYLSCFCAVYKNTQTYLIKDTLISFATSLLYPFAINLFPGIFRMPAIKHKKKCLFFVSYLLAFI